MPPQRADSCSECGADLLPDRPKRHGARCIKCRRATRNAWLRTHRPQMNAAQKQAFAAYKHDWYLKNIERRQAAGRRYHLNKKYGISLEQFNAKLTEQGGVCAVCRGVDPSWKTGCFVVDHDHSTGLVRGLLCHACNTGLGKFREDVDVLERAIKYLRGRKAVVK